MGDFVVLAGGRGSRLGKLSHSLPKPLLPVDGRPLLRRVMDHAASHGFRRFVVALGYRAQDVRAHFDSAADCRHLRAEDGKTAASGPLPAIVSADTGLDASKVDRLLALRPHLSGGTFVLSYCDGLSNIDLTEMMRFHRAHGGLLTIAAVHGRERFGILGLNGDRVGELREKPVDTSRWINGGLFIVEPQVLDLLDKGETGWETGVVQSLIASGQAFAYRHHGWWECVDRPEDIPLAEATLRQAEDISTRTAAQ